MLRNVSVQFFDVRVCFSCLNGAEIGEIWRNIRVALLRGRGKEDLMAAGYGFGTHRVGWRQGD